MHSAGPLTTVQDGGRPGYAHLGVPPSGALDSSAYALANRLVGNPPGAAVFETTFGGLSFTADRDLVVAVTGAPAPVSIDGRPGTLFATMPVRRGRCLSIGAPSWGVRSYVAIAGGISTPRIFGSRSTDLLSGLGPAPVRTGDRIRVGRQRGNPPWSDGVPTAALPSTLSLRLFPGPRLDWFVPATFGELCTTEYRVSSNSNRIAVRLNGPSLRRTRSEELASEGLVTGAVEVPSDGQPLVFLADHPTTGGYPVVGVVDPVDLPLLAQARPGAPVRFVRAVGTRHGQSPSP